MTKTILHIGKYYDPYIGGIETVSKQLILGLSQYNNIVICFSNDKQTHYDCIDGITVIRIGVCASISSQDIAPGYGIHLRRLIRHYHPDAIHIHCPNPFVYPKVLRMVNKRTKLILHWHSDILGKGYLYHMIRPFEHLLLKRSNLIIATSPNYVDNSVVLSAFQHKISILPNVIDTNKFILQSDDAARIKHIHEQWPNKKLLFFFGRHVPYKGIDRLIDAAQWINSNVQILIAGSGTHTSEYMQLAKHNAQITFLGSLPDDELRCYLHAADIFAFPSINKAEAFGVALAEAMYCYCVPVVFHIDGSGVNWVNINHETGLEVPIGYAQEYAKAVNRLAADDDMRKKMALAAHQRICDLFTTDSFNQQIKHIYNKILQ